MSAVVIYSGGMDSFTLLHFAHRTNDKVFALSFNYGQRHSKELEYARRETARLGIDHQVVDLQNIKSLLKGSALTDAVDVPEGHYAQDNMTLTVVPNRNMIMLSIATAWAVSNKCVEVLFGAHSGDHAIYPDCRGEFVDAMSAATLIANYHPVKVSAPLLAMDKYAILQLGEQLGLRAEDYARSWTCYKGGEKPCGKCGSCVERLEAFDKMNWVDYGGDYEDYEYHRTALKVA